VLVETKGHFPPEDRRKMLAIKAQYPHLDIRICFMKADVKLSRAPRALTYWQWAERHGFLWCEGHIPTTWYTDAQQVPQARALP
jgi:Phage endonuclease I